MTKLRLRYLTYEFGKTDIHLCTLRDKQEYHDPEGIADRLGISSASWSIFGVVWPSSLMLAHYMNEFDTASKRILEVGCGIGLPSLLLNAKNQNITATDYHPEAGDFLNRNSALNNDSDIAFERTGWADEKDDLGLFDLIIGSDLLYEDEHIELLANFINAHANSACEVIVIDPGRGRKTKLIRAMEEFGFESSYRKLPEERETGQDYKGYILGFVR